MLTGIIRGATSYLHAIGDIRRHGLIPLLLVSGLCSLIIGGLILTLIYFQYDHIGDWIGQIWIWDWGKEYFEKFADALAVISAILIFFFTFKYIIFILMSPLLSWVSARMEKKILGQVRQSKLNLLQEFIRGLRLALRNIIRELLLVLIFIIMGVALPFLSWLIPISVFLVQAYYAGFGNMDYSLERYGDVRQSINFVRDQKGFAIGNGAVFLLILSIPVIGMLLAPFLGAVSAAHHLIKPHERKVN